MKSARLTVWLHGRVQGVGMRWWIRARALELGLAGWARNTENGRVEVVAEGPREALERLYELLAESGPEPSAGPTQGRPGRVDATTVRWGEPRGDLSGFAER